tara:strand:- start:223 stop:528 length:306 start_codon:yes stop_codon:yes gene_type:complete
MNCNKCKSKNTRVTCTEHKERQTVRYCRCLDCKQKFKTIERYSRKKTPGKIPTNTKLDPEKVKRIRENEERYSKVDWAVEFGVETSTIYNVQSYKTWKHVK